MSGLRRTAGLAAALVGALALVPAARADYGPGAEPASANGSRLGSLDSRLPSLSDDGRYAVLDTFAPELLGAPADPGQRYSHGLVRKDLRTGAVELVGPPDRVDAADGALVASGASGLASISGNGRYVAFETTEGLSPADQNGALDVYVRDMDRPLTSDDAYELVSALDGTDRGADYGSGGSRVGPAGFALSDDGRTAVFFTSGTSNLPGGGAIATPADQVFARALDTRRTTLLTRVLGGSDPAGTPVTEPATLTTPNPVISGDGSTVVWMDGNSAAQTPLLPGEPNPPGAFLWRRLDQVGAAPARRVGGATDLEDPACAPGTPFATGDRVTGPCYGPFVDGDATDPDGGRISTTPSISDDGLRVLFLSRAKRRPYDAATARDASSLYLADMRCGVPRKVAVPRVISLTGASTRTIAAAVLSGDGRHAALTTNSPSFDGPRIIGALPGGASGATDVWVADLDAGTVQRATTDPAGGDYHGKPIDPENPNNYDDPQPSMLAVDDEAHAVAFAAGDGNLFVGDANGARDVQVVRGATGSATSAGALTALAAPQGAVVTGQALVPIAAPRPVYPVVGYPHVGADGIARVTVRVPAAGRLTGEATTKARGRTSRMTRVARTARRASTLTLRFSPSRAVRSRLRTRSVRATLTIRYAPAAGRATVVRRGVTFPRRRSAR